MKDLVVLTLHPCDGFQELQAVQLVVVVGVVLLKVLHQQLGVVQAVDVHVLLLYLGLDVPETLAVTGEKPLPCPHSLSLSRLMLMS